MGAALVAFRLLCHVLISGNKKNSALIRKGQMKASLRTPEWEDVTRHYLVCLNSLPRVGARVGEAVQNKSLPAPRTGGTGCGVRVSVCTVPLSETLKCRESLKKSQLLYENK